MCGKKKQRENKNIGEKSERNKKNEKCVHN